MSASVKIMVINVAMFGSIMPTPFATPTTLALEPLIVASATLCTVSVVMIPFATASAEVVVNSLGIALSPFRTCAIGYWRPITPVEAMSTSVGSHASEVATPATTSRALLMPSEPVATLAFLDMTTTARAHKLAMCSRLTRTLGPANRLCVKTPAAAHVVSATTSVKSSVESLMPMFATWE